MAGFGGVVKLTGESEYRAALKKITSNLKEVSAEMKLVASQFDKSDKSTEALTSREKVLTKQLEEQKSKLKLLHDEYEKMLPQFKKQTENHEKLVKDYKDEKAILDSLDKTLGKTSEEYKNQEKKVNDLSAALLESSKAQQENEKTMSDMRIEMMKTEAAANSTAKEIDSLGKESEDAGEKAEKAGKGGFTVFKAVVADLTSSAIKKAVEGLKELGAKLVEVGKQSLSEYATYEQVVGGVETLFKESAPIVEKYAAEAYKTAGISANEYMQQVTSFSATLLQGLGGDTKAAAEYANTAIADMSDNANKFGSDISSIQNAYQGFAKDNYTMLDNLKLGYGGTASEMARLINDSGVLGDSITATAESVKDIPFSQIIEAIHKVQENLGVTGTTAKEAATTIEGSGKAVSASWSNLLTGIADENANTEKLTKNFTDNLTTYLSNVVPRVKTIITNLGKTVVSVLKQYAPGVAKVLEGVINIVKNLFNFIKNNYHTIIAALSGIAAGFAAFKVASLISSIVAALKTFVTAVKAGETAVAALNAVMNTNPWILLATAIASVITALVLLADNEDTAAGAHKREMKALEAEREEAERAVEAWDDLMKAQQNTYNKGMDELSYYQSLASELENIVDQNGKVKEGYEKRADFIVTTLKDAFEIEIEYSDGVIKNYEAISDSIDKLIEKKKAEILLSTQEEAYAEALKNRTEATQKYLEAENALLSKQNLVERLKAIKDYFEYRANTDTTAARDQFAVYSDFMDGIIEKAEETLGILEGTYNERKDLFEKYTYAISVYETNMALVHDENYADMISVTWDYYNQFKNEKNAEAELLNDQYGIELFNYKKLKELAETFNTDLYDIESSASKERLDTLMKELDTALKETENGLSSRSQAWIDSEGKIVSELSNNIITFESVGYDSVQAYANGVKRGGPLSTDAMKSIVDATSAVYLELNQVGGSAAKYFVDGFTNQINAATADVQKITKKLAYFAANGMALELDIHSPSKVTERFGKMFDLGFAEGVEKNKKAVMASVTETASAASESFADSLRVTTSGITAEIKATARSSQTRGRQSGVFGEMVTAFKAALAQMKIELDDREMGKFVEETAARAIY